MSGSGGGPAASDPEVEWLIGRFETVAEAITAPLRIDNRTDSTTQGAGVRQRRRQRANRLKRTNVVGIALTGITSTPSGFEYDLKREATLGVRVEGLHYQAGGHVDPDGRKGVSFTELVRRLKRAALSERTYPDAGGEDVVYTHLRVDNEAHNSGSFGDAYRTDFDVVFRGYESLS